MVESMRRHAEATLAMPKPSPQHDPTCLSHWFPIIEAAGLPVPRTEIIRTVVDLCELFDGKEPEGMGGLIALIKAAGDRLGWPCFLRTGHTSAKHSWKDTCFLPSPEVVGQHIYNIAEFSECAGIIGIPYNVWVVREMLPVTPLYHCFQGMPVVPEVRVFVDGSRVAYMNPYWPAEALEEGSPTNAAWRDTYEQDHGITTKEEAICADLASRAGGVLGGQWSVDLLKTNKGWFLTDMAEAHKSYGYDPERFNPAAPKGE